MRRPRLLPLTALPALALILAVSSAAGSAARPAAQQALRTRAEAAARTALKHMLASIPPSQLTPGKHQAIGPNAAVNSPLWAGYADNNTMGNTYQQVAGSWQVPTLLCPTNESQVAGFWVGLDGYNAGATTVEQTGTLSQCFGGNAFYYTWWEMWPNALMIVGRGVRPRDNITASVVFNAPNYNLTVNDATTAGNNIAVAQPCPVVGGCPNTSAEWITEPGAGPRGDFPQADFAAWNLTGATVSSGAAVNRPISAFPNDQITMMGGSILGAGYPLATPGPLNIAGNAFTVTWNNSY